jgi:lipopolysaccharide export system protein LptC
MSPQPLSNPDRRGRPSAERLLAIGGRVHQRLNHAELARRRFFVTVMKWLLPVLALGLLCTLVLWPEVERIQTNASRAARFVGDISAARLTDPSYHSVDEHNQPYTLTAKVAQQAGQGRVNLTQPKGDITLQNGSWIMVSSENGVFMQHSNQLDLSRNVTLYRDDGITMTTDSVSVDLNQGAAAGGEAVHAEGPFGTLDAQGFTLTGKGTQIDFNGPAKLVLNAAEPAPEKKP